GESDTNTLTRWKMLENRRHKVKPCLPDCGEVSALVLNACLCKISEFSFNHLFCGTGSDSYVLA
uniref:hypothetical protein n=1 Tax=Serratia marcescens TaxID=615 RepID=UPI001CA342A6